MIENTLTDRRGKLARYAGRLNARCCAGPLPSLVLMTDDRPGVNWIEAVDRLPSGSAVIVRQRDTRTRAALAFSLRPSCRRRRVLLLIADDLALALRCDADGVHIPQARAQRIASARRLRPRWLVTTSAHDQAAVRRAGLLGADGVLVSPVFATGSHPGVSGLGVVRLAGLAAASGVPVLALGGIDAENVAQLHGPRIAGVALISGWLND